MNSELLNNNVNSPIPKRMNNGGLYLGERFSKLWGNVPVIPTANYLTNINLRSANPPPGAIFQLQNGNRGNNNSDTELPGVQFYEGERLKNKNCTREFGPFYIGCIPNTVDVNTCQCEISCYCKHICSFSRGIQCPCIEQKCPSKVIEIP